MKLFNYFIPVLLLSGMISTPVYSQRFGQETAFERQLNSRDDQPLRNFVESKEDVDVRKKANNLEISGDMRFEWRSIQEKGVTLYAQEISPGSPSDSPASKDSSSQSSSSTKAAQATHSYHETFRKLRGPHCIDARLLPISNNDFDVEFNFKLKYKYERAWAMAHLQYDNPAGIRGRNDCFGVYTVMNHSGSEVETIVPRNMRHAGKGGGEANAINLKRCYLGYNILADGKNRLDIEVGRRKMEDYFESEIEFSSRFDGVLLKYARMVDKDEAWYWELGGFVIDERVNQFGFATEIGVLNILESHWDLRYNFIDWRKPRGTNRCYITDPLGSRFANSQVTLTYTFDAGYCENKVPVEFYSGFLINHAAKGNRITHHKKKNLGAYAGFYINQAKKKGDWAVDIEYLYVQAQAVPDYDVGGIGRGNMLDENLYDILEANVDTSSLFSTTSNSEFSSKSGYPSTLSEGTMFYIPGRGNANFKGWRFEVLYLFTDNLSLDMIYEFSTAEDRKIGGPHRYSDFELEAVFAF